MKKQLENCKTIMKAAILDSLDEIQNQGKKSVSKENAFILLQMQNELGDATYKNLESEILVEIKSELIKMMEK
jgi:hypothetical protein